MDIRIRRSLIYLVLIVASTAWAICASLWSGISIWIKVTMIFVVAAVFIAQIAGWWRTPRKLSLRGDKLVFPGSDSSFQKLDLARARVHLFWIRLPGGKRDWSFAGSTMSVGERARASREIYIFRDSVCQSDWSALQRVIRRESNKD